MAQNHANVVTLPGSTPISTSAYSTLSASTPIPFTQIAIANSTNTDIILAYGAAGSETDYVAVGSGQTELVVGIPLNLIPVGSRLAVKAIGAASSSGNITVSLFP